MDKKYIYFAHIGCFILYKNQSWDLFLSKWLKFNLFSSIIYLLLKRSLIILPKNDFFMDCLLSLWQLFIFFLYSCCFAVSVYLHLLSMWVQFWSKDTISNLSNSLQYCFSPFWLSPFGTSYKTSSLRLNLQVSSLLFPFGSLRLLEFVVFSNSLCLSPNEFCLRVYRVVIVEI